MTEPLVWITEQDVVSLVCLDDAIDALERGVRSLGQGEAFNVVKVLGGFGDGSSMHSLGSGAPSLGYVGYKNWVHTKRGATALFVMFNADDGSVAAVSSRRQPPRSASHVGNDGTRHAVARCTEADEMALIGTGAQAITQVAAVNAVRPLRRLRVFSPTPEKRKAFVDNVASRFDFDVVDSPTLEAATRDASIVTLVTRAKDPFLRASMLARGAHLNAVGAILPASAEFDQDVFDRTGMIAVDDVPNARRASRELIERFGSDDAAWGAVKPLGELIARGTGRPSGTDVTIFKSMGMGISDLSVAMLVLERAREQRAGQSIPHPKRAVPRWNTTAVKV